MKLKVVNVSHSPTVSSVKEVKQIFISLRIICNIHIYQSFIVTSKWKVSIVKQKGEKNKHISKVF